MDLNRIQQIISAKAQQETKKSMPGEPRKGMLGEPRTMFNNKKEKIGVMYDVGSGPFGARVQLFDSNPNEFNVLYQGKAHRMSGDQMNDFFTAQGMVDNTSLIEFMRKANISDKQREDVNKINNGKGK